MNSQKRIQMGSRRPTVSSPQTTSRANIQLELFHGHSEAMELLEIRFIYSGSTLAINYHLGRAHFNFFILNFLIRLKHLQFCTPQHLLEALKELDITLVLGTLWKLSDLNVCCGLCTATGSIFCSGAQLLVKQLSPVLTWATLNCWTTKNMPNRIMHTRERATD